MMASDSLGGHRPALGLSTGAFAALFFWAAWVLPSGGGGLAALLLELLALAHLLTFLVVLFLPRQLRRAWRALSWCSLSTGALLLGMLVVTAREMVQRFGSLGGGVASLLAVIGVLAALATAPFGAWGLLATRRANGGR
jgi:hypothetical protein